MSKTIVVLAAICVVALLMFQRQLPQPRLPQPPQRVGSEGQRRSSVEDVVQAQQQVLANDPEAVAADMDRADGNSNNKKPSDTKESWPWYNTSVSSPHYSLDSSIMGSDFAAHVEYLCNKIDRAWTKNWKRFDREDISGCLQGTPECAFFRDFWPRSERPYRKCCVEHGLLRDTAFWVIEQLTLHNITYFFSTGSALGLYRHGGTIIPWDTDVDMAIYPASAEKVKTVFANNGLHYFHRDRTTGKPMFWVHASKDGKPRDGPHVEIFYDSVYTAYPKELLPLQPCRFYRHPVTCPHKRMLDVWFPSGWTSYGGCHYHGDGVATVYDKGARKMTSKC